MGQQRSGCSGLIGILFLICLATAIYKWPSFVDAKGTATTGTLVEKRESVRVYYTEWYRRLQIIASFHIPGQPLEHHDICDVDQRTYDSLHDGNQITVHYLPALLSQPFVSAIHLSPCKSLASVNVTPGVMLKIGAALGVMLFLLLLWRVLRLRIAAWLLAILFLLSVAYIMVPRTEPAPERPQPTKAKVQSIDTVTTLSSESHSMPLPDPYEIVSLQFTPPGMDGPVVGVDTIDLNSIPSLQVNQMVDIDFDAGNPRIVRLHGGTRRFPEHVAGLLILTGAAALVLLIAIWLVGAFFRLFLGKPINRAAKMNAMLQRGRRRRW